MPLPLLPNHNVSVAAMYIHGGGRRTSNGRAARYIHGVWRIQAAAIAAAVYIRGGGGRYGVDEGRPP